MAMNHTPHFVGLGGTGADILASILSNRDIVLPLLKNEGVRVSCLALDVANAQIDNLVNVYNDLTQEMKLRNIPREKLSLVAKSVKFNTPEGMFDFVRQFPQYLKNEDCVVPENYRPWLSSTSDIPPLSGGVGRKRALSKAIYAQNHYLLRLTREAMGTFKEVVISTEKPVIFVFYGIGGGSGSGMALDFTRHLRKLVGSVVPIVGFCILPCSADDPPAKGASAYAALIEHGPLLNKTANMALTNKFGRYYDCPFDGFFFIPLAPALGQGKGLRYAHQTMDQAIADTVVNCLNFDLADMLGQMGARQVDLENKWVHTISTIRVSYPIQEYIDLTKSYLEKLDKMRILKRFKKEIYGGTNVAETGGLIRILDSCRGDLKEIYRQWLLQRGRYEAEKFEEVVKNFIYEDRSIDTDFALHIKGVHDVVKGQMDELYKPVLAVRLDAKEGNIESRISKFLSQIYDKVADLPRKHFEFEAQAPEILDSIREDLKGAPQLTHKQIELISDVTELADLIQDYLKALRGYMETKKFAEKLYRLLEGSEQTELREKSLITIKKMLNPELVVIFSFISSMFWPLDMELKNIEEYLTNCRRMRKALEEDVKVAEDDCSRIEEVKLAAEGEKKSLESQFNKVNRFFSPKKHKFIQDKMADLTHRIDMLSQDLDSAKAKLLKVQRKKREYEEIGQKYEVNSEYRRLLPEILEMTERYYDKVNSLARDTGYYERTGELTEEEQLKIMQRILKGDEKALSRENILGDIVNFDHLRRYLASVVKLFQAPETFGLTSDYKTDLLWFIPVLPADLWNKLNAELRVDILNSLAVHVKHDVSRSISIREGVRSDSPWTVRFLVVAAHAWPECLREYQEMKQLYEATSAGEKKLAHSFLLEQGLQPADYSALGYDMADDILKNLQKGDRLKG